MFLLLCARIASYSVSDKGTKEELARRLVAEPKKKKKKVGKNEEKKDKKDKKDKDKDKKEKKNKKDKTKVKEHLCLCLHVSVCVCVCASLLSMYSTMRLLLPPPPHLLPLLLPPNVRVSATSSYILSLDAGSGAAPDGEDCQLEHRQLLHRLSSQEVS